MGSQPTKKQQFWFSHLGAQRQSGLSQKDYCKEHALSLVQMGYYSRVYNQKASRKQRAESGSLFVKLPSPSSHARTQFLSVKFPSGATLECPASDLTLLREVVRALHEKP